MKHPVRILAGTALGLLMASAPSVAQTPIPAAAPMLLAQADDAEARKKLEEEEAARQAAEEADAAEEETPPAAEAEEPAAEAPEAEAPTPQPEPDEQAAPAQEAAPEPAPTQEAAPAQAPAPEAAPEAESAEEAAPAGDAPRATETAPAATGETVEQAPAARGDRNVRRATGETPAPQSEAADDTLPENAAPVLDSAKEAPASDRDNRRAGRPERTRPGEAAQAPAEDAAPPPTSDQDAQAPEIRQQEIQPITATEGRRVDRDQVRRDRRQRPEGAEVVRESEGRVIFEFNNQIFVQGNDLPRLSRDARDVYYEELPRGLVRETIVRPNGVQIVTIRNRHGEIVRRSRISPDGRETVLTYLREDHWDRQREWRDPGDELPPLRLRIPVREYILDAGRVDDADTYYAFLDQPPVEQARRLYSVDEVKRSARLRDTVRRVDLDTITFATGSAEIARSEVDALEAIATAMLRLLDENPAETFLIEGHTDAVGSDISNLALSDARAESAADALTRVFGIPPENLVTQGYGERYLKVATEGPSRENRRVAIRRITPLVAPVASTR
ncbi:MAG: OmpA family protein [Mesorhizobium sp.]